MKFEKSRALIGAVLSMALVVSLFPVPSGSTVLDRARYGRAEAIAPAVPVAVVFATALAAYGVYIAGSGVASYEANRAQVYSDFMTANNLSSSEADSMMAGAVTPEGNIDLEALASSGFFGLVPALLSSMFDKGSAITGETSKNGSVDGVTIEGRSFPPMEMLPVEYARIDQTRVSEWGKVALWYKKRVTNTYPSYDIWTFAYAESPVSINWVGNYYILNAKYVQIRKYDRTGFDSPGYYETGQGFTLTPGVTGLNASIEYVNGASVSEIVSVDNYAVVVEESVQNGSAVTPTNIVQVFEPTVEQLSAGYDSTTVLEAEVAEQTATIADLQAQILAQAAQIGMLQTSVEGVQASVDGLGAGIDDVNGNLGDILDALAPLVAPATGVLVMLSPLAAILTAVNAIVTSVQSIAGVATGVQSSPFAWLASWWQSLTGWWATLLQWLAVNDVASWWGTLSGWWQGLLDWVGATPIGQVIGAGVGVIDDAIADVVSGVLGLASDIAGVISAVNAGVAAIVAALDGVLAGEVTITPPTLEAGTGIVLADQARRDLEALLDQKAPFCYVRRVQAVGNSMAGAFSSSSSFYVDVPLSTYGDVRFDAGQVLNQSWNGNTVAWYMRMLLTAVLCAGLIALAIRISLSVLGVGGGKGE